MEAWTLVLVEEQGGGHGGLECVGAMMAMWHGRGRPAARLPRCRLRMRFEETPQHGLWRETRSMHGYTERDLGG